MLTGQDGLFIDECDPPADRSVAPVACLPFSVGVEMKFAANLSTLCNDIPKLTDRFVHLVTRKDYTFTSVECQNPYDVPIEEWKQLSSKHSIEWVLINTLPLFAQWTSPGLPSKEEYKSLVLDKALDYAKGLSISKIHLVMNDVSKESQGKLKAPSMVQMLDLLDFAARTAEPLGVTCVIEPLCIRNSYYLRSYDLAKDIVTQLSRPNLKVMLDTFHMQMLGGNLTATIDAIIPHTGHVQVSQAPTRNCPMASGEINYPYVLKNLSKKWNDAIGLEYNSHSTESFAWLKDFDDI